MSIQFVANTDTFRVDSGTTIPRAFTLTEKVKLDDTAIAGTVLSIVTSNFKTYRIRWSGTSWEFINNDGTLLNIGGTATTSAWVSVAIQVTTTPFGGGNITRVSAFVKNDGGSTLAVSGDTEQYVDTIGKIFVGNPVDYSSAGRNNARFKAADLKAWSVVLSQADIEAEWLQQAPVRTADRVVVNYFDGGNITAAQSSDYAVGLWAETWARVDSDGNTKTFPTYSAEAPSYAPAAPSLSGEDTLPQLTLAPTYTDIAQATAVAQSVGVVSSAQLTFATPPATGRTVVALGSTWRWGDFPTIINNVTDNRGNSYSLTQVETGNGDNTFAFLAVAQNIQTGSPFTVTASFTTANDNAISWLLVEVDTTVATSLNKLVSGAASSGTSTSSGETGVLSTGGELLLGVFGSLATSGVSQPAGWDSLATQNRFAPVSGGFAPAIAVATKRTLDTASHAYTVSHDLASGAVILASFRTSGASGSSSLSGSATASASAGGALASAGTLVRFTGALTAALRSFAALTGGSTSPKANAAVANSVELLTAAQNPAAVVDIPALPASTPVDIRRVLEPMREYIQTIAGRRGEELDTAVTFRDLITSGIAVFDASASSRFGAPPVSPPPPEEEIDFSTPPAPTDLTATGGVGSVFLGWNGSGFRSYAFTEIWRANVDDLGQATKLATSTATQYADYTGSAGDKYYWVRFVSEANITGPFNAVAGTLGTPSEDPTSIIELLRQEYGTAEIDDKPFFFVSAPTTINGVVIPPGTYVKAAYIADATIGSAKIRDLTASKITSGYTSAAIGFNGAKVYGASLYSGGAVTTVTDSLGNVIGFNAVSPTFSVNDGAVEVYADYFRIRNPNSGLTVNPFYVSGNQTYIDGARIGNYIQSTTYTPGSVGWRIDSVSGDAEFNNAYVRGKVVAGVGIPGGQVELGDGVGPGAFGHYGLSLSNQNFDNVFMRRNDGVVFFRVNLYAGSPAYINFNSVDGLNIYTANFRVYSDGSGYAARSFISQSYAEYSGTGPTKTFTFAVLPEYTPPQPGDPGAASP